MIAFFRKLLWLAGRRRKERELQEELQFHIEEEVDERRVRGGSADEAYWAARRELGNLALLKEDTRAAWGWTLVEQFLQDCRYAFRTMAANKMFSALAILSLALGIGANTAIYSFTDSILLRSLPVSDPGSLALVSWHSNMTGMRGTVVHGGSGTIYGNAQTGSVGPIFPYPAFELFHKSTGVFSSVFGFYPTRKVNLIVNGQAEVAEGELVSGEYFRGLGVPPAAGRVILTDDDRTGAAPVVVISYAAAQRRFGDAAGAPGQSVVINNVTFLVVGVAAPGFHGVDPAFVPDFYIPLHDNLLVKLQGGAGNVKDYLDQNYYWLEMMARLRPGVSLKQAQSALAPVFQQWVAGTASSDEERAHLPTLLLRQGGEGSYDVRYRYLKPLYVLMALVVSILAIACANIANLLLARATARRREMAVRLSMGAGRFRVIRQLLTESLMLSAAGGVLGVLLAVWGIRFLMLLLADGNGNYTVRADLNWHVLAAAAALSLLTGVLFGLAPALQATRVDVMPALKQSRAGQTVSRHRFFGAGLSRVLVVSQIGISLLMLVAAGLFARTLSNLQSIELGFQRDNLLLFQMNARQAGHKDPEINQFYTSLLEQFRAIQGVRKASATHSPMIGHGTWMSDVVPAGQDPIDNVTTHILMTGDDFFATMHIPVLLGRALDGGDRAGMPPVAVVNEAYVKVYFSGRNPLGRHLVIGRREPFGKSDVEIVGVAKNARYGGLTGDFEPVLYVSFLQGSYYPVDEMTFVLRTAGDPLRLAPTVRALVRRADPRIPVTNLKTEAMQIDQTMSQHILFARLCTAFAILALVIACVGLYGTMTYTVARRIGEIGIRMALGARRGMVVWMVLREVLLMAFAGLAIGLPVALATSKLVKSFLFEIQPNDPNAMIAAVAILMAAAVVAGYLPAWKASRIDPLTALRHE